MLRRRRGAVGTALIAKSSSRQSEGSGSWIGPTSFIMGMIFIMLIDLGMGPHECKEVSSAVYLD